MIFKKRIYQGILNVNGDLREKFRTNRIICVNKKDNLGHKRFAIAHEFAHYVFDYDESKLASYYDTYYTTEDESQKDKERLANQFAANLLMPKEDFIKKYRKIRDTYSRLNTVEKLSEYYGVSSEAIVRRITELEKDL